MTDRLAWSPDGRRVLVLREGALTIRDPATGATIRELPARTTRVLPDNGYAPARYLTARWLADGRIVAVDTTSGAVQFSMRGEPYNDLELVDVWGTPSMSAEAADISADGSGFVVAQSTFSVFSARTTGGDHAQLWRFSEYDLALRVPVTRVLLSADTSRFALRTPTTPIEWVVFDVVPVEKRSPRAVVATRIVAPGVAFVRDQVRPIALPADGFVADAHGARIARADATSLHVTYRDAKETLSIDHGLASPITALAFGADAIACLTAGGALELLPIP